MSSIFDLGDKALRLWVILSYKKHVVTYQEIADFLGIESTERRAFERYVTELRKAIGTERVKNVFKMGYILSDHVSTKNNAV